MSLNDSRFDGSASHLWKWAWSKGYYWHSKVCFLPCPSLWNRQWSKIKTKLYDKRDDFTFPIVNFLFSSSNIPTTQFHISYGNLVFVIQCSYFLKEFNYIRRDYWTKATLLIGRSHHYQNNVIKNLLTGMK